MWRRVPWLVTVGLVLLAAGVVVGTRPVGLRSAQSEIGRIIETQSGPTAVTSRDDPTTSARFGGFTDCGTTFVPRHCEPSGPLVWLTGVLVLPGVAAVAAGVAQLATGRRDARDRWSGTDAVLLVGLPVLVVGTIVAVITYNVFMYRRFEYDP